MNSYATDRPEGRRSRAPASTEGLVGERVSVKFPRGSSSGAPDLSVEHGATQAAAEARAHGKAADEIERDENPVRAHVGHAWQVATAQTIRATANHLRTEARLSLTTSPTRQRP